MKRFYLAITNNCNRACEFCSMYSKPGLKTEMPINWIYEKFDDITEEYEVQLEGGEPMIHSKFWQILHFFNVHRFCKKIILTTNGTRLLRSEKLLKSFCETFLPPFVIKPSVNHHLLERDPHLFTKCERLKKVLKKYPHGQMIINVRRRRLASTDDDKFILDELYKRDLLDCSNVFYIQRYGKASDNDEYELPFIIENPVDFHLYSPDGVDFGTDLIRRSKHMMELMVDNKHCLV